MRLTTRGELVVLLLAFGLVCWLWLVGFRWYVEALLWAYSHWSQEDGSTAPYLPLRLGLPARRTGRPVGHVPVMAAPKGQRSRAVLDEWP